MDMTTISNEALKCKTLGGNVHIRRVKPSLRNINVACMTVNTYSMYTLPKIRSDKLHVALLTLQTSLMPSLLIQYIVLDLSVQA